jgi:hypothetical protein
MKYFGFRIFDFGFKTKLIDIIIPQSEILHHSAILDTSDL